MCSKFINDNVRKQSMQIFLSNLQTNKIILTNGQNLINARVNFVKLILFSFQ